MIKEQDGRETGLRSIRMTMDSTYIRDTGIWRAIGEKSRKFSTLYFSGFGIAYHVPELQCYFKL